MVEPCKGPFSEDDDPLCRAIDTDVPGPVLVPSNTAAREFVSFAAFPAAIFLLGVFCSTCLKRPTALVEDTPSAALDSNVPGLR